MKNSFHLAEDEFVYLATDTAVEFALNHLDLPAWPNLLRVKIGRTNNPFNRMQNQFRNINPDMNFIHLWYMPGFASEVELALKRRYRHQAINPLRELFIISSDEILKLTDFPASAFKWQTNYLPDELFDMANPLSEIEK